MRALLVGLVLAALMAAPAAAKTPRWGGDGGLLTRRHAQHGAAWFARRVGPLLDPGARGVTVHMAAPRKCHRRDRSTVLCWFSVHLVTVPETRTGFMRVHLQRNRLLGYKLPWDPLKVGIGY